MRLGEKHILKHYLDLAQAAIPLLQSSSSVPDLVKANGNEAIAGYFAQLVAHTVRT